MQKVAEASDAVSAAASEVLKRRVVVKCVPADESAPAAGGTAGGQQNAAPKASQPGVIGREARARFGARPYQSN